MFLLTVVSLTRYSDGNVFAIPNTRVKIGLEQVSRTYNDQKFTLMVLNRGSETITIFFNPLLGNEEAMEIPTTSPGIVLDNLPYEKLINGIDAISAAGTHNLVVNLYSNDITFGVNKEVASEGAGYARDTHRYPERISS